VLPQIGLVLGAPQADAARLADRPPQPDQVAAGGQFLGTHRFGRAARVHLGRIGTFRDGRRDLDDEFVHHGIIVWPHRTEPPRPLFSRVRGGSSQCT